MAAPAPIQVLIASDGDVEMQAKAIHILRVRSKVLLGSFAEDIDFARICKDGNDLFNLNLRQEHDGEALLHMFALLHDEPHYLPSLLTPSQLMGLAAVIDQYDVKNAVIPRINELITGVDGTALQHSKITSQQL
ncbi:uncharacterized protein RHO25_012270 [Cercospora beticola]|uniref:BTB domain-containing protein n=1 Tax=Cercospora beticola TaxID=122368 RepID=A0ABZ0P805_CERBT|nr:hypothetical protein RHO25_012270 [Cercospora beticola]